MARRLLIKPWNQKEPSPWQDWHRACLGGGRSPAGYGRTRAGL